MVSNKPVDTNSVLELALTQATRPRADGSSELSDFVDSAHAVQWLQILAVPRIFRGMNRVPPREHLLKVVDIFVAYARSGERYGRPEFQPVPYEQREPLALRLRELIESWTPPDLPAEITEAARALLYADGAKGGPGGWDSLPDPDMRPEDYLLWPEGVPALLKG